MRRARPRQEPKSPRFWEGRGTTRTIDTDEQGSYVFPSMPVGLYTLRMEAAGFKTSARSGVELSTNENARVDETLEVGNLSQSVSVVGEAPLVDSRSSVVETLIDSRRVVELPINGRNIISLTGFVAWRLANQPPDVLCGPVLPGDRAR